MKCINKHIKVYAGLFLTCLCLCGCGSKESFENPYDGDNTPSAYSVFEGDFSSVAKPFASELCVVNENVNKAGVDVTNTEAAGLFDLTNKEVLYAANVHRQMNPASLTKVMTALIALENVKLDETITATANVNIQEQGAQLCGFQEGDTFTMDQALYGLLMYSGNDAGVAIAEHVAGSVEAFADMMNEKAKEIGATNTHFSNPHGLTAADHYTTAYDLYLIFNEAMKYDKFVEIIHSTEYSSVYHDKDGNEKEIILKTTNQFLSSDSSYTAPEHVTVIGGKTGTTEAAGACLILLSNDAAGNPYISVILKADDKSVLYTKMTNLLTAITGNTQNSTQESTQAN
ncbi:MAG: D-alanyl-D-alanine carboxypeptidase [Lachnospiraceae bacterium]|nr:D-alanyl-D-alanine carboxypeptidase [Lachnospiraceae bacterium]